MTPSLPSPGRRRTRPRRCGQTPRSDRSIIRPESAAEVVVAALAALLHGGEGFGYLFRRFHTLLGDRSQLGYRPAVTIDRLGKALGIGPDLGQRIMLLLGVARLGEVRPGRFDIGRQGLGMGSKGLAIEGQAITQHAAHRLAVFEEGLERRLALAFR